jgi:hypothetical protein
MEFLPRRLLAITDGEGSHIKHQPEEISTQESFSRANNA